MVKLNIILVRYSITMNDSITTIDVIILIWCLNLRGKHLGMCIFVTTWNGLECNDASKYAHFKLFLQHCSKNTVLNT